MSQLTKAVSLTLYSSEASSRPLTLSATTGYAKLSYLQPAVGVTSSQLLPIQLDSPAVVYTPVHASNYTPLVTLFTRADTSIAAEATTARAAEVALGVTVSDEKTRAEAAEGVLDGKVTTEKNRATAAEGVLRTDLATEASDARAAELVLSNSLAGEVSRAIAAEAANTAADVTEASTARAAELKLTNDLAAESVTRASAVTALIAVDVKEASDARAAELVLRDGLAAELVLRASEDVSVATVAAALVDSEATTARLAEIGLDGKITTEKSRAEAAELVLRTDLASEVSAARAAELVLRNDLATEVSERDAAIVTERTNRMRDVNAIIARVNFIVANTDTKALDSLAEIVGKVNSVGSDVYARLVVIEAYLAVLLSVDTIYPETPSGLEPGVPASSTQPIDLVVVSN